MRFSISPTFSGHHTYNTFACDISSDVVVVVRRKRDFPCPSVLLVEKQHSLGG
jgi:hypothetical protein